MNSFVNIVKEEEQSQEGEPAKPYPEQDQQRGEPLQMQHQEVELGQEEELTNYILTENFREGGVSEMINEEGLIATKTTYLLEYRSKFNQFSSDEQKSATATPTLPVKVPLRGLINRQDSLPLSSSTLSARHPTTNK